MSYFTQSLKLVCICPTSNLLSRLTTAQVLSSHRWLETTIPDSTGRGQSSDCRRTNANHLAAFFLRVLTSLRKCWVLHIFPDEFQNDLGKGIMVSVVKKNACCWFGIKFYVICEMGLVNYSYLLFFALFLHPLFWGGVGWRGLYYLFICKKIKRFCYCHVFQFLFTASFVKELMKGISSSALKQLWYPVWCFVLNFISFFSVTLGEGLCKHVARITFYF